MRPTRRGYAVVLVVVGGIAAGAVFGARALDAVVLPAVVALAAAAVQLRRVSPPALDRTVPPAETAGTERTITVALDGDRRVPATVYDRLPAAVDVAGSSADREAAVDAAVGGRPASYEVVPRRRGTHAVGPATVVVTDVLGLLRRSVVVDARDTLVAYPRVGTLPTAIRAELRASHPSLDTTQRDEFDDLREYVRGDSLRDVHWKSSARHDDLMVMEFADRADPDRVTVAAGVADGVADPDDPATPTPADRMADAAATVCVSVLRTGGSVTLATPSGEVEASPGRLRPALAHLASAEGGRVPAPDADVVVVANADGATIRLDGRDHRFDGPIGDAVTVESASDGIGPRPPDGAAAADATPGGSAVVDGGTDSDRRAAAGPGGDGR